MDELFGEKMAKKISVRLYLDGASQFNKSIREIDNNLNLLNSVMKQNNETFKDSQNSAEALRAKSETLNKQYEEAEKKVKAYSDRLQDISKAHDKATQDYENYNAALQKEKEKLEEIEKTQGKNSTAYTEQAAKVKDLESSVSQLSGVLETLDEKEIKTQTALNNATTEQIKYGNEITRTTAYLEEAEKSTDGCAESIDKFGHNVNSAEKETSKISETLGRLAENEALEKISESAKELLEGLIECAETAEQFEYAIAKVQSIAQVSESDLANMSSEIRRVGSEMGYSANEISEATYQAISASVDASEAVGFVEDATKLARAGFTETTTAVDVLTTAINAYGKEANTTAHIADDLITTQNLGKTTVDELAHSIGTVIPTAAAYGVSLDQLSTAYTLLTKQGINTAYSTTYIRSMLNELGNSGSDVADILFDETGHSFGELTKMGYTLGDVMQVLGDSVDGDSESFANLFGNIRAGQGALALYNTGAEVFNDTLKVMGDNAGATNTAFEIMADTAVMTNQRFSASVENLKIAVGESLSPTIDQFKEKGIDILQWFTQIAEENPKLVTALAGAAAGIVGVTTAATAAAAAIGVLKLAFGDALGAAQIFATVGVAGAAGVMAGLATSSRDAASAIKEAGEALGKTHEQNKETIRINSENTANVQELAKRYNELAGQAGLTDEALNELNGIITQLNANVPGLNLAYRDNRFEIEGNTEAIKGNIDALIEEMRYQENLETLNSLYKEQAEAEKVLAEATAELSNAQNDTSNSYDLVSAKISELTEKQEEAQRIYDENQSKIDAYSAAVENYAIKTQEAAAAEQIEVESKQALEEAQRDLEDSFKAANEAIGQQIGIFSEWSAESDLTLGKMMENWAGQTKGVNQYKEDLIYLKEVIDGETDPAIRDLSQQMATMGIGGAAEIHNFVEGLKQIGDNKEKVTELAETWQEHIDAIKNAEGIYASIKLEEKGYIEESERVFNEFYTDSEQAQRDYNDTIVLLAEQGVKDQAQAIADNAPEVQTAVENMMNDSLQTTRAIIGMSGESGTATVYSDLGKNIVDSIREGIESSDGSTSIGNALGNILQNAADSVNVSGIAAKINAKLGETVNREMAR